MAQTTTEYDDLRAIRQHLHQIPEIGLQEVETSDYLAEKLAGWGYQLTRGLAKTGIVASLSRPGSNRVLGLRSDIDALPLTEETGLPYASRRPGMMHACGHDGHMTMLLGAARRIAEDPDFTGTVHLIFQPAEENWGGAKLMMDEGLLTRFPCERYFALHNYPGLPAGHFSLRDGPMAASIDVCTLTVEGKGGHGAMPEATVDPIVAASAIVLGLQSLVARNVPPHEPAVVTVGAFNAGSVSNIIPERAKLEVSLRATSPETRALLQRRIEALARAQAESYGASAHFQWELGYPATINDPEAAEEARSVIRSCFGAEVLHALPRPMMGSEDFAFLLEQVKGAYIFIGNGDSEGLHSARYVFNDAILTRGAEFFHQLARRHNDGTL